MTSVRSSKTFTAVTTRRQLRAAIQGDLDYPRTRTVTYGSRTLAVSGPTCWNLLPSSLKSPSLIPAQFCKQLKQLKTNTHGAAVVTMLQNSRGDTNCSSTLTLALTFVFNPLVIRSR